MPHLRPALALGLALLILAPVAASAATGDYGAAWRGLSAERKADLIAGAALGLQTAQVELALADPARALRLRTQHDFVEAHLAGVRTALDRFYADGHHARVPTHRALRYCIAELTQDPDARRWLVDQAAVPHLAGLQGRIAVGKLRTPYAKDPTFVAGGTAIAGKRYIAFGDLERFYLKPFSLEATPAGAALAFAKTELPVQIEGLAPKLAGEWSPDIQVVGDTVVLLFSAGVQDPDIVWPSFRLHKAALSVAEFGRQAAMGGPVTFREAGEILTDLAPFGPNDQDFGVIDPHLSLSPPMLTYTVVRYGVAGKRYHEEAVHGRRVDPRDPARATGPDEIIYEGRARTADDGVAEAQDVVTLHGHRFIFVSSRAGDRDQRLLVAPAPDGPMALPDGALQPFMDPGGEAWKSSAVGSSGAAELDGHAFVIYQGMDRGGHFGLGWAALAVGDDTAP